MSQTKDSSCSQQGLEVGPVHNLQVLRCFVGAEQGGELGQGGHKVVQDVGHGVVGGNHGALGEAVQRTAQRVRIRGLKK